jgi:cytochrome c2
MPTYLPLLIVTLFAAIPPTEAFAAGGDGDPVSGRPLAARWCTSCHLVANDHGSDRVRPLASVAADPAWTADRLRGFLARPHGGMPDANLTVREIDDLIAFIATLR